jgi:hypothetical protein
VTTQSEADGACFLIALPTWQEDEEGSKQTLFEYIKSTIASFGEEVEQFSNVEDVETLLVFARAQRYWQEHFLKDLRP